MISTSHAIYGQELPPQPMIVTVNLGQNLSFGAFYQGSSGGSVIISPTGSRSSTGDIVLLGMGYIPSTALYDIVANPGTLVSILKGPDAILSSGGNTMTLKSESSGPFVITATPPSSTQLKVGGTLIVGSPFTNPPGNYTGTFDVTFVQE